MDLGARREGLIGLLSKARRLTSIMIDLSIYSLAFGDKLAALEALAIEDEVDEIVRDAVALMSLAVRSPSQEGLAKGIVELAAAFDRASDAAGDMAQLALRGYPPHRYVTASAICCGEVVAALKSERSSEPLEAVDVVLVRRGGRSILSPEDMPILRGDVVIVRGALEAVYEAAEILGARPPRLESSVDAMLADETARGFARAKVLARAGYDASLYSLLAGDEVLARTILEMEEIMDLEITGLMEALTAQGAGRPGEVLAGYTFLSGLEDLSDAAARVAGVVVGGLAGEVLGMTVEDPWESYLQLEYSSPEPADLEELGLDEEGIVVVAARVGGRWVIPFVENPVLEKGDTVLAKIYAGQAGALKRFLESKGFTVRG
ncbi:MAG: hypothetical protein F7B20_06270 [Aeropyrum sp.]|nr:hypothetical protein [Aeropyrum sp.]MCE4616707.1 hypothetical protein [Aeropyrum sp.]